MANSKEMNIILTEKQNYAYSIMCQEQSIFLTGPAGTGKTELIKMFSKMYKKHKNIAITSTTGTSAILIGGTTLHSYLGIGLAKGSVIDIIQYIKKKNYLVRKWVELEILIIDEISMLSPVLFDKLEEVARKIRGNKMPFGGIQLILSGDLCQLPCVGSEDFCFEAKSWNECIKHTIYLTEIIRQENIEFQNCLNKIRVGDVDDDVVDLIESRIGAKLTNDHGIKPTKLYPLNRDVDAINEKNLNKLAGGDIEFYEYEIEINVYKTQQTAKIMTEKFKKYCNAVVTLQLCVGAQVMLLHNLDVESGLANGSRGIVVRFEDDLPVVKFLNGIERVIDYHTWENTEKGKMVLEATQIPLRLAYAISIHKSQGCSLDYVKMDLRKVFEYGQAYVALSRVRNLEGLSIIGIDWGVVQANPKVIEYYENFI